MTLVEPRYPVNVGHVARLLKNFGVRQLYLVKPEVDISVAAIYASHAADVLDAAQSVTLSELRESTELLVATTAIRAMKKSNVIRRTVSPERLRGLLESARSSSLVFGRDTTGLTNDEMKMCDATVTIETVRTYKALNLGHAVAILLYLCSRERDGARIIQTREARTIFAKSFYELALASEIHPHKIKNLEEASKRIASASGLSDKQLQLMTGVFRKATKRMAENQDPVSKT